MSSEIVTHRALFSVTFCNFMAEPRSPYNFRPRTRLCKLAGAFAGATIQHYLNINIGPALLDVLMAGNKFEVASCMRLPSSVPMADVVQPLRDPAKQFLATWYKDITKQECLSLLCCAT
ncbi:hypothetical protein LguiA_002927 [Lonicera macranthoides]